MQSKARHGSAFRMSRVQIAVMYEILKHSICGREQRPSARLPCKTPYPVPALSIRLAEGGSIISVSTESAES